MADVEENGDPGKIAEGLYTTGFRLRNDPRLSRNVFVLVTLK
jgi:hypothetical protein